MARYKVILNTGEVINVPIDKSRSKYEEISTYGMGAVLERAKRTRIYKKAHLETESSIHTIITPNGEHVTQF